MTCNVAYRQVGLKFEEDRILVAVPARHFLLDDRPPLESDKQPMYLVSNSLSFQ
jgi:hypothetical protein